MQAASLTLSPSLFSSAPPSKGLTSSSPKQLASSQLASIRTNALSVNYNSVISVFPAEACETIGGDTCVVGNIYQEVKLKPEARKPRTGSEPFDREYLDYDGIRTVLLGEACDVLGGEFCNKPYQNGIY